MFQCSGGKFPAETVLVSKRKGRELIVKSVRASSSFRSKRFLMMPFWSIALVLAATAAAWACGLLKGTFSVTGTGPGSGTVTSSGDGHDDQTITAGIAKSCGGVSLACLGNPGSIIISTGPNATYLDPSASPIGAGTCQPLGIVINQCGDAGTTPANPTLGPYLVRFFNGPVYASHAPPFGVTDPTLPPGYRFPNCGLYGNGNLGFAAVTLGTVTVGAYATDTAGNLTGLNSSTFGGSYNSGTDEVTLKLPPSAPNVSPAESAVCIVDRLSANANIAPITIT